LGLCVHIRAYQNSFYMSYKLYSLDIMDNLSKLAENTLSICHKMFLKITQTLSRAMQH
jgi:hypothetical protein